VSPDHIRIGSDYPGEKEGENTVKRSLVVVAVIIGSLLQVVPASAANGDLVTIRTFSENCPSGIGVGIAYDGENLWYSCARSSPDLYRADPLTGKVTASYDLAGGLGALAYDATRNALWAGPGFGETFDSIILIELNASKEFVGAKLAFEGAGDDLDDGLAFDATDDSLYISPDTSTVIEHYTTTGKLIGSTGWAGAECYNSGLAIGGTLLYQGSDGCNHIWVADKSSPETSVFDFASPEGVRDEDLECDPNTFAPTEVMWSMEAYDSGAFEEGEEPRRAAAFEIPAGSCGVGGEPGGEEGGANHGWMTGGGSVFTKGGGRVTHGFELHCTAGDGPNSLQVNWGKGNRFHLTELTSAACADDPEISPDPPVAGFDTLRGAGTGTYNGKSGATAEWVFGDAGEPGSSDTVSLTIKDASEAVVLSVSGTLEHGNQQAHAAN